MSAYLPGLVLAFLAAGAGVLRRSAPRPDRWALLGVAVVGVTFALAAATARDPEVPLGDVVLGVAVAGLLLGALPAYVFFALGRALGENRIVLAVLCVAAAVALTYYYVIGGLLVVDLVYCPPDAYECPV